jgi:hypothetical protein
VLKILLAAYGILCPMGEPPKGKPPSKATISEVMRHMGRRGGQKRVPKGIAMLTPEERAKRAREAAAARWGKKPKR